MRAVTILLDHFQAVYCRSVSDHVVESCWPIFLDPEREGGEEDVSACALFDRAGCSRGVLTKVVRRLAVHLRHSCCCRCSQPHLTRLPPSLLRKNAPSDGGGGRLVDILCLLEKGATR